MKYYLNLLKKRLDEYLKINNHVQLGLTIKQDIDYYPQIILFVNILCEKYENEKKDGKNFIKKRIGGLFNNFYFKDNQIIEDMKKIWCSYLYNTNDYYSNKFKQI